MENLVLNETPVRTSKNYNINNILLENIEIPSEIGTFKNVNISEKSPQKESPQKESLQKNGLGEELTKQVNEHANFKSNIVIDSKTNKDITIDFEFDDDNKSLVDSIKITANEGTKSTVIIKYRSKDADLKAYHNGAIKAKVCCGAVLNVIVANFMNNSSNNFLSIEDEVEANARINFYIVDFGGKNTVTNYYSNVKGKEADSRLNALYIGKDEQLIDLNYIAELYGEKSNADIEVQGALNDSSRKHFKGTIDFKKGCKKATGNENENCILLSDKAKSLALPMLLCSEEDVEGNHSTSSGKIAEKELFYLMSRGFTKKEAMKLMVRAKFNKILEEIKNEDLKNEILEFMDKKIG